MKVKELIAALSQQDPDLNVYCYTEDESMVAPGHHFGVLDIERVDVIEGEPLRGEDGVPTLKRGRSDLAQKIVILEITSDH